MESLASSRECSQCASECAADQLTTQCERRACDTLARCLSSRLDLMDHELQLPPSSLGTKGHWDAAYELELSNFEDNGDVGDVWFGEKLGRRIAAWIEERNSGEAEKAAAAVLDVGCGNGQLLLLLRQKGFQRLTGIDYSEHAVALARKVADKEGANIITFQAVDVLQSQEEDVGSEGFDFVVDKGTFDAISLNPHMTMGESVIRYTNFIKKSLKSTGYFVIASCNWTKEELLQLFSGHLQLVDEIASPAFAFGGKQGSRITTLICRKISQS